MRKHPLRLAESAGRPALRTALPRVAPMTQRLAGLPTRAWITLSFYIKRGYTVDYSCKPEQEVKNKVKSSLMITLLCTFCLRKCATIYIPEQPCSC